MLRMVKGIRRQNDGSAVAVKQQDLEATAYQSHVGALKDAQWVLQNVAQLIQLVLITPLHNQLILGDISTSCFFHCHLA